MRVQIAVELLSDVANFEVLDDVARLFQTGRHVWDMHEQDIEAIESSAWLTSEPDSRAGRRNVEVFTKSAKLAIEQGGARIDAGDHHPSRAHTARWDIRAEGELEVGLRELGQPARIFVEDDKSDAQFVSCLVRAYDRASLGEALEPARGWASVVHCGGKPNIKGRVDVVLQASALPDLARQRMLALLDSDRRYPGHDSQGVTTAAKIERCGITVKMLRKREAENYIPVERLAELESQYQAARQAFVRLTPAQRDHFDMKKGFELKRGKARVPSDQRELYASVSEADQTALVGGFGPSCGRVFGAEIGREELEEVCRSPELAGAEHELRELVLAMEALL